MRKEISRRDFIKGAAAGAVSAAAMGILGVQASEETSMAESEMPAGEGASEGGMSGMTSVEDTGDWKEKPAEVTDIAGTYDCDLLIIGLGHAGSCAARAAAEAGAKVMAFESQAEDSISWRGGGQIGHINSQFLLERGVPGVDEIEFLNDWQVRSNNRSHAGLIRNYIRYSGECFDWLIDCLTDEEKEAVTIRQFPTSEFFTLSKSGIKTWIGTAQLGNSQATVMQNALDVAIANGAELFFETGGYLLLTDDTGAVTGAIGERADGTYIQVNASKGVLLSAGDFSSNASMCKELLTEIVDLAEEPDTLSIGGMGAGGKGHQLGYWAGGRMEPKPLSTMGGNYSYPCDSPGDLIGTTATLWVNAHGKRYCNEGFGDVVLAALAGARQPSGDLCTVFGNNVIDTIPYQAPGHMAIDYANTGTDDIRATLDAIIADGTGEYEMEGGMASGTIIYMGETAEELGERLGFTGEDLVNFVASIDRYNELCEAGADDDFGKDASLMHKLEAPYFAYKNVKSLGSMLVTTGGLMTDENQNVLGQDFEPIPGLFASGNTCGGRFGMQYTTSIPGVSLSIAQTLGKLAGEHIASR